MAFYGKSIDKQTAAHSMLDRVTYSHQKLPDSLRDIKDKQDPQPEESVLDILLLKQIHISCSV